MFGRGFLAVVLTALLLTVVSPGVAAQETASVWERAVEAMQYNNLGEAIPLLELAIAEDPGRGEAVRMLAAALEATGDAARAESVLREALDRDALSGDDRGRIAFDLALSLGRQGRHEEAVTMYDRSLELNTELAAAYLNRANARVSSEAYEGAVRDYELYLALRPDTSQRPQIEQMIAVLQETIEAERIAREEAERRAREEEEARRIAEEERRRREAEARREAEERRQAVLDSVLESLGNAEEDASSFEMENEDIRGYDDELDIVD